MQQLSLRFCAVFLARRLFYFLGCVIIVGVDEAVG